MVLQSLQTSVGALQNKIIKRHWPSSQQPAPKCNKFNSKSSFLTSVSLTISYLRSKLKSINQICYQVKKEIFNTENIIFTNLNNISLHSLSDLWNVSQFGVKQWQRRVIFCLQIKSPQANTNIVLLFQCRLKYFCSLLHNVCEWMQRWWRTALDCQTNTIACHKSMKSLARDISQVRRIYIFISMKIYDNIICTL